MEDDSFNQEQYDPSEGFEYAVEYETDDDDNNVQPQQDPEQQPPLNPKDEDLPVAAAVRVPAPTQAPAVPLRRANDKLSIEAAHAVAAARGGKCLSTEYVNSATDLKWQCKFLHEWTATLNNVRTNSSWCPACNYNVGEELTRAALVEAFPGKTFEKTRRVPWMQKLELDGYNEELKLAFEYQGIQHYEFVPVFHRTPEGLAAQQARDALTASRCRENGVALIIVPYSVKFHVIRAYVRDRLKDAGRDVAPAAHDDTHFYDTVRANSNDSVKNYDKMAEIVKARGGVLVSKQYVGYRVPMEVVCGHGHKFQATLEGLARRDRESFCPDCGGTKPKEEAFLKGVVEKCGFVFRGTSVKIYPGDKHRRMISITCPNGHAYDCMWDNFQTDTDKPKKGCAICNTGAGGNARRKDITEWLALNKITIEGVYKNNTTNYTWRCTEGHVFSSTFATLRMRQQACLLCKRNK